MGGGRRHIVIGGKDVSYLPSTEERKRVRAFVDELVAEVLKSFSKEGFETLQVVPVGSTVKGTFVAGDHDVDIYVITDDPQRAEIHGTLAFEPETGFHKHAGPLRIWCFKRDDFDVDLVFVDRESPKVDTYAHTDYFNEHLSDAQRDEVVRLKAIFKTYGVYGAEQGGITGVALEELVNRHKTAKHVCATLTAHLSDTWLQDPVLETKRNLLASITPLRWKQLTSACWSYLKDTSAFQFKPFTRVDFEGRFRVEHSKDGVEYKAYPRMHEASLDFTDTRGMTMKAMRELAGLEPDLKEGQLLTAFMTDTFIDEYWIVVAVALPKSLPATRMQRVSKMFKEGVEGFKAKHSNWSEDDEWVTAVVPRKVTSPREFFWTEVDKEMLAKRLASQGIRADYP